MYSLHAQNHFLEFFVCWMLMMVTCLVEYKQKIKIIYCQYLLFVKNIWWTKAPLTFYHCEEVLTFNRWHISLWIRKRQIYNAGASQSLCKSHRVIVELEKERIPVVELFHKESLLGVLRSFTCSSDVNLKTVRSCRWWASWVTKNCLG